MGWRRILTVLHRDLGYFFAGVTLLYVVSGILVNHNDTWSPDYAVTRTELPVELPTFKEEITDDHVRDLVESIPAHGEYRGYDFASAHRIKVYFDDGSLTSELGSGIGTYETVRRRELILRMNRLHLHPSGWWRIFSDIFVVGLLFLVVSGLIMLKGRRGFSGRGKWFFLVGCAGPTLALMYGA